VVMANADLKELQDPFDLDPRYYNFKSMINVIFGAAAGAYIGLQFSNASNNFHTFWTLVLIIMLLNGFVLSMLMLGSKLSKEGPAKSWVGLIINTAWLGVLVWLAQRYLNQGWVFAAFLGPWYFVAMIYASLLYLIYGALPKRVNK
jgi:hypothetical protein